MIMNGYSGVGKSIAMYNLPASKYKTLPEKLPKGS